MMKTRLLGALTLVLVLMGSCDLLNCTQANVSLLRIEVCSSLGSRTMIPDTLTISASGTDYVLLNKSTNTSEILLPLSHKAQVDTFVMKNHGKEYYREDTLFVTKTNNVYFESPDCPTVMMHSITSVSCAKIYIDSANVVNKDVNFEESTHLKLFIHE